MRCQRCQRSGFNSLDFCATCLRSLCALCTADGCCDHRPALSGQHYDRQGLPKPVVQDERDDDSSDGTTVDPINPDNSGILDFHRLYDECLERTIRSHIVPAEIFYELGGEG